MNLLQLARRGRSEQESRYSLDQYVNDVMAFNHGGLWYSGVQETYKADQKSEQVPAGFDGVIQGAYRRNGVVFACQMARLKVFSEARFQFQQMRKGRPGDLFGTADLSILEDPWVNGSTGELLARMIQDADLCGNFFARRTGPMADVTRLERLRPDWMIIVLGSNRDLLTSEVVGYGYYPGGLTADNDPVFLAREEVVHWSPIPDPLAQYRGMSWLSPVIREVRADGASTDHKLAFFDHAATPNMVVKFGDPAMTPEKFQQFKTIMEATHQGVANAWKTLYLGGGADVTVVGSSFKDMDFRALQGAGETRIAAAAGVPPIVVGLSEGLQAATYSNYAQARRAFADTTMRPLWRSAAAALSSIIRVPQGARLWYDDRDIPFLQEDRKDAAEIQSTQAATISSLVLGGFTPDSVVAAVQAEDFSLLAHTGKLSVQLQDINQDGIPDLDAKGLAEVVQKVYLGVGPVITQDEAREILNKGGAGLPMPGPGVPDATPAIP